MGWIGGGYMGPREVSYLFIDGGYLDKVLEKISREFFEGQQLPLDAKRISSGFTKTFYYNCLPVKKKDESEVSFNQRLEQQTERFEVLQRTHGWHVQEGILKLKDKKVNQKEVDVLIAVDMLTHSYRRNMHKLSFIAGDRDFRPLVDALVRDGMFVELLSEIESVSKELILTADAYVEIDLYRAYEWLDDNFKKFNKLPERHLNFKTLDSKGVLVEQGENESNETAEIYVTNDDNGYLIITRCAKYLQHQLEMTHQNLDFLKKIHSYLHKNDNWKWVSVSK